MKLKLFSYLKPMKKYLIKIALVFTVSLSLTVMGWKSVEKSNTNHKKSAISADSVYRNYVNQLYTTLQLNQSRLSLPVFEKALTGFINLKKNLALPDKSILTIVNFDQLSTEKRLYIIDINKKIVLLNSWVAHGLRSGHNSTTNFSNLNKSYASSLGFYVTGEIYSGIHGKSLRLDGVDEGFNDNARKRAIVLHGAPYVNENTINALGRLGRSQGCPAVAQELADQVITTIADKTVLFINKSNEFYTSKYLDESFAAQVIYNEMSEEIAD